MHRCNSVPALDIYFILFYFILYYIILYYIILYYIILFYFILFFINIIFILALWHVTWLLLSNTLTHTCKHMVQFVLISTNYSVKK